MNRSLEEIRSDMKECALVWRRKVETLPPSDPEYPIAVQALQRFEEMIREDDKREADEAYRQAERERSREVLVAVSCFMFCLFVLWLAFR